MTSLKYLTPAQIVEINARILSEIVTDRRDRHAVWDERAIRRAVSAMRHARGDAYSKAAVLIISLVKAHAFKSGNRRTAYVAAKDFLENNGFSFKGAGTDVLVGIRLGEYKKPQVEAWLKGNE